MNKFHRPDIRILLTFCALMLFWGSASARIPTSREVLDNWARALGGRDRIDGITCIESQAEMTMFGMEGTITHYSSQPDKYLMKMDLGGIFSISQLTTSNQTWAKDQDGNVGVISGKNRSDLLASAYLENLNHLRSGASSSIVTDIRVEEETGLLMVAMNPPEGTETTYYLDQKTWLPVRSQSNSTGGEVLVVTYSDWQPSQGVLFTRRVFQSGSDPQNDLDMTVTSVKVNPQWTADPFAPLKGKKTTEMVVDSTLASSIPIRLQGVHIYVDVRINGEGPFQFIFDSGAGMTVINKGLAESLNLSMQGQIAGGGVGESSVDVALAKGLTIGMPGIIVPDQTVGVIDIENVLEGRIGCRVDGILGFGFITQFVSEIDYANLNLALHDPSAFNYQGDGVIVPMGMDGSTPRIKATVKGYGAEPVTGHFMLDTGSGGAISMSSPFARKHGIAETMPRSAVNKGGFGVGGHTTTLCGRLESVEIGGLVFREPVISISHDDSGAGADENTAGLFGGQLMSRCRTFLDYAGGRLILEPNEKFSEPFSWNKCGISIGTRGRSNFHHFTVTDVVENSPGQKSGILKGDVLLKIAGRPAEEWEAHELLELFKGPDRDLVVVLGRNGKTKKVVVKLRDFI